MGLQEDESAQYYYQIGLIMLTVSLLLSALLGHLQNYGYTKWRGTNPIKELTQEAMFYQHLLCIPFFATIGWDVFKHIAIWNQSPLFFGIPQMWIFVILNVLSQSVCIKGVYLMTGSKGT